MPVNKVFDSEISYKIVIKLKEILIFGSRFFIKISIACLIHWTVLYEAFVPIAIQISKLIYSILFVHMNKILADRILGRLNVGKQWLKKITYFYFFG